MNFSRALVLQEKNNPSTDYFVLPALKKMLADNIPIEFANWGDSISPEKLEQACVIIVRYLSDAWRHTIHTHRARIGQLVYFMDDDLGDWRASSDLSLRYRYKLYCHATRHWSWLIANHVDFWVSTEYLQNKYSALKPQCLTPQPLNPPLKRCRVFYHATASHRAEIDWLLPVMKQVLDQAPMVDFEIIGDRRTWQDYRHLPRTTVVHPMSWESYHSWIAQPGRDIGLAPFLPSPFNAARSYTKMFDIERAGARGIYSELGPWTNRLRDLSSITPTELMAAKTVVLMMDPDLWVKTIISFTKVI